MVALQAVMADLLGGDTIHHALNIPVYGKTLKRTEGFQEKADSDVMKAISQLRWLIIDEISMVSARLLADIDQKLRDFHRATAPFRTQC